MDGFLQGVEQDVARGADRAADDDELWVEGVDDRRDRAAEHAPGVGDRAARAGVAVGDERHDLVEREVVAVAGAQQGDDRAAAGHHLQAAAVAAAADRAALVDEHVAELAGGAAGAAVQLAAEDEAGADAAGDHEVDRVARADPGAERDLGERAEVRVVVEVHVQAEPRAELVGRPHAGPAGQDLAGVDGAGGDVDRARQADAGAEDAVAARRRRRR